jgi:hypothetical protein
MVKRRLPPIKRRERRYQDRCADPADMTVSEIEIELAKLSGTKVSGFREWELEARKFRLKSELTFIRNGGRNDNDAA